MRGPNKRAPRTACALRICAIAYWNPVAAVNGAARMLVNADFELDHIISLKQRGSNTPENLAVACPECNRQKGQKHPARFAAEISIRARRKTLLVERILQHYAMESHEQAALFAQPAGEPEAFTENNRDNFDEPHYRW